jgi:hypothetical protein
MTLTSIEKIDRAIAVICPRNKDGTFNYAEVSVRDIAVAARAGHTTTHRRIRDLRTGAAVIGVSAADVDAKEGRAQQEKILTSPRAMSSQVTNVANGDSTEVQGQNKAVESATRSPSAVVESTVALLSEIVVSFGRAVARLEVQVSRADRPPTPAAPDVMPAQLHEVLADLGRSLGRIEERMFGPTLINDAGNMEPATPRLSVDEAYGLSEQIAAYIENPTIHPSVSNFEVARERFLRSASQLLADRGPMKAGELFNLIPPALKEHFYRRQTPQLLRWGRDQGLGFHQWKDRRWHLASQPDPKRRRTPSRQVTVMRQAFGEAAVEAIRAAGVPLGAEQIWDQIIPKPPFVRRNAANVLPLVDHPDLVKTPDGAWGLQEWSGAFPPRPSGYHSRVRLPIYATLGTDVLRILQENGRPMSSREIRPLLRDDIAKTIKDRQMADVLRQAQRDCPLLVRDPDSTWRIASWERGNIRRAVQAADESDRCALDNFAKWIVGLLRRCDVALEPSTLHRMLPDNLNLSLPQLQLALRRTQCQHPELVEVRPNFFAYRSSDVA